LEYGLSVRERAHICYHTKMKIFYADYNNIFAELKHQFHASTTFSSPLTSISKFSSSSTIDSYYCLQCLRFFDKTLYAVNSGCCNSCTYCPVCEHTRCLVKVEPTAAFYFCPYCEYDSRSQSLSIEIDDICNINVNTLADLLAKKLVDSGGGSGGEHDVGGVLLNRLLDDTYSRQKQSKTTKMSHNPFSNSPELTSNCFKNSLLPTFMPLQAKISRRCKREVKLGRPGILLKPKVNPLEGDSFLRAGHGQWNKKNLAAELTIPKVELVRVLNDSILLCAVNPSATENCEVRLVGGGGGGGEDKSLDPFKFVQDVDDVGEWKSYKESSSKAQSEGGEFTSLSMVEDEFLDDSKPIDDLPYDVGSWSGCSGQNSGNCVFARKSSAYFEFNLAPTTPTADPSHTAYFYLRLELKGGDKNKIVTIKLLASWRKEALFDDDIDSDSSEETEVTFLKETG